jgi:hypothetical protein
MAYSLLLLVRRKWKRAMMAPSNSVPCSVRMVIGENDRHRMFSQMFVAMNSEMPEPRP